jgi:hypothetical protein
LPGGDQEQRVWQGSRAAVAEDRRAWGQAIAIFLVVAGEGISVRLLGGPSWLTVLYLALGAALAAGRVGLPELAGHSREIRRWAAENGVTLTSIQHDVEQPTGDGGSRPALQGALERIGAGDADTLVTTSIGHLSPTVAKLSPLLRVLTTSPRTLVVLDHALDTATEAGGWPRSR